MLVKEFEYRGYDCEIRKHDQMGHLCGYVRLRNPTHDLLNEDISLGCHGGITFREVEGEETVIGFDCSHYTDGVPAAQEIGIGLGLPVRDEGYVTDQLRSLVDEIVLTWGEQA